MAASPPEKEEHTMKRTMTAMLALCLAAGMALPASALEYTIEALDGPDYGKPLPWR
ncbi:sortase [Lawsonibacter asaccharolyticus]|nr:sortase [Lawsonibacter asaccharolyticus]